MKESMPNHEIIESFIENLEERYRFDKTKDWSIDDLEAEIWNIRNEFQIFRASFPSKTSIWQGEFRAYAAGYGSKKKSLSEAEHVYLTQAQREAEAEIRRAVGYRKQKIREQRSDWLNSIVDICESIQYSILGLWATVKQLTPW